MHLHLRLAGAHEPIGFFAAGGFVEEFVVAEFGLVVDAQGVGQLLDDGRGELAAHDDILGACG